MNFIFNILKAISFFRFGSRHSLYAFGVLVFLSVLLFHSNKLFQKVDSFFLYSSHAIETTDLKKINAVLVTASHNLEPNCEASALGNNILGIVKEKINPNIASALSLEKAGFRQEQIRAIFNLRKSRLYFKGEENFLKWAALSWPEDSVWLNNITELIEIPKLDTSMQQFASVSTFKKPKNEVSSFKFSLDTISEEQLKQLGYSEKTTQILVKAIDSLGSSKFNEKKLKFLPGIPKTEKEALLANVIFAEKQSENNEVIVFNINTIDSIDLIKLKGVGPYVTGRVLACRRDLGGYYSLNQLYDIPGLNPSQIEKILPHVYVDAKEISPLKINRLDKYELSKNPYISWPQALNIVKYRKMYGWYKGPNDLRKYDILPDSTIKKLEPYLYFK
ncbi:MAG: ComEA family DNA-binding protein [Luteibaculaceae bacterium]